jgi:transcriptional regulator with XRE-family HTH domain
MRKNDSASRQLVAARIREARKMAGLSQGQLAKLLNLHRPAVSEIEAGNRSVSAEELGRLSELLDVSVTWIVGESPEKIDVEDPRVQLAARELGKLKPEDLDRLLKLLAAIKE